LKSIRKPVIVALNFVILLLLLSGCNDSMNNGPKNSNNDIQNKTAGSRQLAGDLELQIFVGGYGDEFWKKAIDIFKKENPEVNVIAHMGANVNTLLRARWMSNNPPDFVYYDGPGFDYTQYVSEGKIMDLKEWFDTAKTVDGVGLIKDNIYKGFLKEENGKIYSAPYIFTALGMWYNAKFFRDNHIAVPSNFDEFLEVSSELKKLNAALMVHPGMWPSYLIGGFLRQELALEGGEQIFNDINLFKQDVFVSSTFIRAMSKLEILSKTDNGILQNSVYLDHIGAQLAWLDGKAAFIPNGLWLEREMEKEIPDGFELSFIPSVIQDKSQKYIFCSYSTNVCLSSMGKNPENAKAWLAFLYREDILKEFTRTVGIPTAYQMDLSDFHISDTISSVQKWVADPNVIFFPVPAIKQQIEQIIGKGMTDVLNGKINSLEACSQIQKEVNRINPYEN